MKVKRWTSVLICAVLILASCSPATDSSDVYLYGSLALLGLTAAVVMMDTPTSGSSALLPYGDDVEMNAVYYCAYYMIGCDSPLVNSALSKSGSTSSDYLTSSPTYVSTPPASSSSSSGSSSSSSPASWQMLRSETTDYLVSNAKALCDGYYTANSTNYMYAGDTKKEPKNARGAGVLDFGYNRNTYASGPQLLTATVSLLPTKIREGGTYCEFSPHLNLTNHTDQCLWVDAYFWNGDQNPIAATWTTLQLNPRESSSFYHGAGTRGGTSSYTAMVYLEAEGPIWVTLYASTMGPKC